MEGLQGASLVTLDFAMHGPKRVTIVGNVSNSDNMVILNHLEAKGVTASLSTNKPIDKNFNYKSYSDPIEL